MKLRLFTLCLTVISTVSYANVFPPTPGQRYDVGGYDMHIHCLGKGSPTVLVDVGLGDDSTDWLEIQQQVAQETKVCVFDRPGYGWSDFGPQPRDSKRIAFELQALLPLAGLSPPYIMVGHSFGGYNIRVFTANNPDVVTGMVLVDASHEDQYERFNIKLPKHFNRRGSVLILPKSVASSSHADKHVMLRERAFHAARAEISVLDNSAKQVQQLPPMPPIPLAIISRGKAEWFGDETQQAREKTWNVMQHELFLLSPLSHHSFAHQSGHDIPHEQPAIVVEAISDMVHTSRRDDSL